MLIFRAQFEPGFTIIIFYDMKKKNSRDLYSSSLGRALLLSSPILVTIIYPSPILWNSIKTYIFFIYPFISIGNVLHVPKKAPEPNMVIILTPVNSL
jgi:hypothetical protein